MSLSVLSRVLSESASFGLSFVLNVQSPLMLISAQSCSLSVVSQEMFDVTDHLSGMRRSFCRCHGVQLRNEANGAPPPSTTINE